MTHYKITWPNGKQEWFVGIQRHREDGPAVSWDGWFDEWWLDDVELTLGQYRKILDTAAQSSYTNTTAFKLGDRVVITWGRNQHVVGEIESIDGEYAAVVWRTTGTQNSVFRWVKHEDLIKA